jgi:carbonic anhydrase
VQQSRLNPSFQQTFCSKETNFGYEINSNDRNKVQQNNCEPYPYPYPDPYPYPSNDSRNFFTTTQFKRCLHYLWIEHYLSGRRHICQIYAMSTLLLVIVFVVVGFFEAAALSVTGWTYDASIGSSCMGTVESPCGPEYWPQVPGASDCAGDRQSPINIGQAAVNNTLSPPTLFPENGGCKEWYQFSNNYTFEIAFVENGEFLCTNMLTYEGEEYVLAQIHVHSPSEHTFGGGYYSAEAHLVHVSVNTNDVLVLGVMLQDSATNIQTSNNSFFQTLWSHGGPSGDLVKGSNLQPYQWLLPPRRSYYTYQGSLTTPPCSEIVRWLIFDQSTMISQSDLNLLRSSIGSLPTNQLSTFGNNNRNPQPALNNRTVEYVPGPSQQCSMKISTDEDSTDGDDANMKSIRALVVSSVAIFLGALAVFALYSMSIRLAKLEKMLLSTQNREVELQCTNPISTDDKYQSSA